MKNRWKKRRRRRTPPQNQNLPRVQEGQRPENPICPADGGKDQAAGPFHGGHPAFRHGKSGRYLEEKNAALARTLGETGGLGTVATRADIIEKLFHTFLLEKKGSEILITSKARQLLKLVPEDLKKPELTARWELQLSRMAKGELKREEFMKKIREYAKDLIREIRSRGRSLPPRKYHRQDLPPLRQTAAGG